ncbi:hypothetical protein K501DRAFT_282603 [Backusella circina FSU 941]|nr:hypothetical protein K501DRAFT_282603 [Backusella circina FSU 941]
MKNCKHKPSSSTSDTDSTDSFAVISEHLTASDDYDTADDNNKSNSMTQISRNRSVPYLKSSSSSILRHSSSSKNSPLLKSTTQRVGLSKSKTKKKGLPYIPKEEEEEVFNKNDLIVSSLKSTFADILVPFQDDHRLVPKIQSLFDTQEDCIDLLEKKLGEKRLYLKKLRAHRAATEQVVVDEEGALPFLLAKYPVAMNKFRKRTEEQEYMREHERCTQEFEAQREEIIRAHKRNYEALKSAYKKKYKREVERIEHQNE